MSKPLETPLTTIALIIIAITMIWFFMYTNNDKENIPVNQTEEIIVEEVTESTEQLVQKLDDPIPYILSRLSPRTEQEFRDWMNNILINNQEAHYYRFYFCDDGSKIRTYYQTVNGIPDQTNSVNFAFNDEEYQTLKMTNPSFSPYFRSDDQRLMFRPNLDQARAEVETIDQTGQTIRVWRCAGWVEED